MQNFDDYFPLNDSVSYLNHAAVSPWPKSSYAALENFARQNMELGATHYPKWLKTEQSLREHLAQLINIDNAEHIALAKNTSEALSVIAHGLQWQQGDEVLLCNHEFPSNRIVWESLASKGVTIKIIDVVHSDIAALLAENIGPRTRLVSVSSVQYASGIRTDLVSLGRRCRDSQILLCVDAIQSLGAVPFDQQQIQADFVVADGHKWMMGPEGIALLYIKPERYDQIQIQQFGWHMIKNKGQYDKTEWNPAPDATRFECGSPNMLGIHTLEASLGLLHQIGIETIFNELEKRLDYLIERLSGIKYIEFLSPLEHNLRAGIVTFRFQHLNNTQTTQLYQLLMQNNVICANRGGGIRFSPHFYTQQSAMDRAVGILEEHL